jgi:hypothetical protein
MIGYKEDDSTTKFGNPPVRRCRRRRHRRRHGRSVVIDEAGVAEGKDGEGADGEAGSEDG